MTMKPTVFSGNVTEFTIGGQGELESPTRCQQVLDLLTEFFAHKGPIGAIRGAGESLSGVFYPNARLLVHPTLSPIVVRPGWVAIHTENTRFSWEIDQHTRSLGIMIEGDVCSIYEYADGITESNTCFMRCEA